MAMETPGLETVSARAEVLVTVPLVPVTVME